jgi:hypothetical protein
LEGDSAQVISFKRQECPLNTEKDAVHPIDGSWVDSHEASYRYRYPWAMVLFPIFGLPCLLLVWRSHVGLSVWIGAEVLLVLAGIRWNAYRIELKSGSVSAGWALRMKTFALVDVDLIQHLKGGRGGQLLRIRHSNRILLTVTQDIDGFDDLVGFFREYARHHHLIFATRDNLSEWTQESGHSGSSEDGEIGS